jgi:hypothetical protein
MLPSFVDSVVLRGLRAFHDFPTVIVGLELWHAWRTSRQLCHWFRLIKRDQQELSGCALYIQILQRRSALSMEAANELIDRAEESYCEWPTKRPLRYRDLVQYIAIEDLMRQSARGGVLANVAFVVARVVPMNW